MSLVTMKVLFFSGCGGSCCGSLDWTPLSVLLSRLLPAPVEQSESLEPPVARPNRKACEEVK